MATPIPENRAGFSIGEIERATDGKAFELAEEARVEGVSTDSRNCPPGALFVALSGPTFDGHRFVADVRSRAAGAVPLVASGRGISGPRVEVADPLVALGALARAFVERESAGRGVPILAIGGAAGKTTTKTLAAAAVEALLGETLVTAGNLNNRIGVPMTLLTLEPRHRAIVLEHGTSEPGEIAALAAISNPHVGLVVNVGVEHSERLGGVESIADEEAGLLLAARRRAVTSADDPLLVARSAKANVATLTFGRGASADLRVANRTARADGGSDLVFALSPAAAALAGGTTELAVSTRLLGEHVATNVAAAALAALALLGRPATAEELAAMTRALGAVEAVPGRLRPVAAGDLLLLDDSYNANPRSMRAALAAAREIADRRRARLVLALGDMLELGELAAAEHEAIAREADAAGAAEIAFVGAESGAAVGRLGAALRTPFHSFLSSGAAADHLAGVVRPGDVVLVKGSRGIRMEQILERLQGRDSAGSRGPAPTRRENPR